ncbi:MAG: GPR endopeptidase [Clostridia bacterium]
MEKQNLKFDMAFEAAENLDNSKKYNTETKKISDSITQRKMLVKTDLEAKELQKKKGIYITLECDGRITEREVQQDISKGIKNVLRDMTATLMGAKPTILVVGLGNEKVVADALGAMVVDDLIVTRNIIESDYTRGQRLKNVCAISTGVFGVTGIESFDIIKGIVDRIKASLVIVIDTLATTKISRVFKSFQLTNAGIEPGSASQSGRKAISQLSLGVPTIAIGVPLAMYARAIIFDSLDCFKQMALDVRESGQIERRTLAVNVLGEGNLNLIVTPKDIDEAVKICAKIIADGINLTYQNTTEKKYFSYF